MIDLKSKIDESLFDGRDEDTLADDVNKLVAIKRACYKNNSNIFDGVTGWVRPSASGIEIYAPMFPSGKMLQDVSKNKKWITKGAQEFVIDSNATKLNLNISKFRGNLYIKCKNLQTLEGIFTPDCEFEGRLSIWHCPNLKSLKGLPRVISPDPEVPESQNGFLSIYDCPQLSEKDIQYLPDECNELHWASCQEIGNKLAQIGFRKKIVKRVKGLNSIDIEGHFHRI